MTVDPTITVGDQVKVIKRTGKALTGSVQGGAEERVSSWLIVDTGDRIVSVPWSRIARVVKLRPERGTRVSE